MSVLVKKQHNNMQRRRQAATNQSPWWKTPFGVLGATFLILVIFGVIAGIAVALTRTPQVDWIHFGDTDLTSDEKSIVSRALLDWNAKFGCWALPVTISTVYESALPFGELPQEVTATPGTITLNLALIHSPNQLRYASLYAAAFACQENRVLLTDSLVYPSGVINGFEGMTILVQEIGGNGRAFSACQSAWAEWAAHIVDSTYSPLSGRYLLIEGEYGEDPSYYGLVLTSDFPQFVADLKNKAREEVTVADLIDVSYDCLPEDPLVR
jgi:hypothetical protein